MFRRLKLCGLPALFAILWAGVANAEISVAPSVEWITCSAQAIVVGKIKDIKASRGPGDVTYEDCVVEVARILKGDLDRKQTSFTLRRVGDSPTAAPLVESKAEVLVFLSKSKDHGPERHLDDKWVPTALGGEPAMFDLAKPGNIYSKDIELVAGKDELLRIVGLWAMSPVKHSLYLEVPGDSPVFDKLYAGSACFLIVPAEEKFRAKFMLLTRSPISFERAKAAGELAKYPGAETEAVLHSLLTDDTVSFSLFAQDQIEEVNYHVRAAAQQSLKSLGKPVPEVVLVRKPTAEEQRKLREKCWSDSFTAALKEGWAVSVADGASRRLGDREHTIVVVTCRREKERASFTLVPKVWPATDWPKQGYIGTNGPSSQGARRFHLEGSLPDDVKRQVVAYFGLEK